MLKDVSTYRRIVKSTGVLGGVQIITMLCSIVKTKWIAIWIGAEGMGIMGLYNTSIDLISQITGFGLGQSGVREISKAVKENPAKVHLMMQVVRSWAWVAGLLGAVLTLSMAPLLSKWTFGTNQYIWGFVCLSCALLFRSLTTGEQAIIQGNGRLRLLAKSSVYGSVSSLLLSLPLFYFFRINGVVPVLVINGIISLFFVWIFNRQMVTTCDEEELPSSLKNTLKQGTGMIRLGIYMTIGGFVATLFNYIFMAWMNHRASMADVGYYQAGYTLIGRYAGIFFAAMGTEFYPRLSSVSSDNQKVKLYVSLQAETLILILIPVISLFLLFQPLIIRILYTSDFMQIKVYLSWAILGILFKAVSWTVGFILLAKGSGKLFLSTEIISAAIAFVLNIVGYLSGGLEGVGIAYIIYFGIYMIGIIIVCHQCYRLEFADIFTPVFFVALLICGGVFVSVYYYDSVISMIIASFLCILAITYSVIMLKSRVSDKSNEK